MKKKLLVAMAAGVPLVAAIALTVQPGQADTADAGRTRGGSARPAACADLHITAPDGARLVSTTAHIEPGGTLTYPAQPGSTTPPPPVTDVPAYCDVDVTLTHGDAGDRELIEIWLPTTGWTGRFEALGGSGYFAGDFGPDQANAIKAGYAVGTTDAGATPTTGYTADWALTPSGEVNTTVLTNFAERGPHELAVVGKAVTRAYYGKPAAYAYWNGCSTGGRQGYMEAQRHPTDFDGILANAPALSWDRFAPADLWPAVVMNAENDHLSKCELDAFTDAAVAACDGDDGIVDHIIGDPLSCDFDPRTLIGTHVLCDGQDLTITATDATVVDKIWDGPRTARGQQLWYGPTRGADLNALAGQAAFPVAASWVQNFLKQDPTFDVSTITYAEFADLFRESVADYHDVIGSDDPNLSAFRGAGGKLLTWHGLSDQLVPVEGTIRYRKQVEQLLGGSSKVDSFYRLFLAPGAPHCQAGVGPAPTDPLAALVTWVEKGDAPTTLAAATIKADGTTYARDICLYPRTSHYNGHGDPDVASSYTCAEEQQSHR